MAYERTVIPCEPGYSTETELCAVERQLARLGAMQFSLTPPERVQVLPIQLSPISLLPNEILIHIFLYGLDEVPESAHALPLPIVITGVCKSWRAVALRTPELWTRVHVTSACPANHLQTLLERSGDFEFDVSVCHWPAPKDDDKCDDNLGLKSIILALHTHARRLRSLSVWNTSDATVYALMRGLSDTYTPCLTDVSVKAHSTAWTHYYQRRHLFLLPFLKGKAPLTTHLELDHFPIESFRVRSEWPFNAHHLASLTLRTQECTTRGFYLPPYLIEFPALCALLRGTPNLTSLALYGPVIEPDEDFPVRPPGVTLPLLETLVIHRREPGVRYHCELLSVLTLPTLARLEIPWHDDLAVEPARADRVAAYLLDAHGEPRFGTVRALCLHDSAVRWQMPTRSLMRAFPNVEEVVLGGTDVARFATTLRGCVWAHPDMGDGVLGSGAWEGVRRVVLREPEMECWKGWVRGMCKWLAAGGHAGEVCVEIRGAGELDERGTKMFKRGIERLGRHARIVVS